MNHACRGRQKVSVMDWGWFFLMTTDLSKEFGVIYDHAFSKIANHQIRHETTHKVGCQFGDSLWSFIVFLMGWGKVILIVKRDSL